MNNKIHFTRTLGPVSARFIAELQQCGKVIFTIDDASNVYGRERDKTINFLSDLTKRGLLARIKSGVYLILQVGQENAQLSNWPVIAHELAGSHTDYFISHYSAMRLHGMTTHPLLDVYISMSKRCGAKKIGDITYHFVYVKPENFWGHAAHWATKQDKVYVSDIERTLLDGLDRPDLCGGIKEIIRGIWIKHKEIDMKKLVQYATRFHTKAVVKRLGFILELFDFGVDYTALLAESITSAKDYIFLDPNGPKEGKCSNHWRVRVNMNIAELKASVWG